MGVLAGMDRVGNPAAVSRAGPSDDTRRRYAAGSGAPAGGVADARAVYRDLFAGADLDQPHAAGAAKSKRADLRRHIARTAGASALVLALSDTRPTWDQYFMTITRQVAERSTCLRAKVGAVIVRDR